jgi:hypothetical protein
MAVLTSADYKELRRMLYRFGEGKEDLKALPNLPSEAQLLACFQAIEDKWVADQTTYKGLMETALNRTITNTLARLIGKSYLYWRWLKGNS